MAAYANGALTGVRASHADTTTEISSMGCKTASVKFLHAQDTTCIKVTHDFHTVFACIYLLFEAGRTGAET